MGIRCRPSSFLGSVGVKIVKEATLGSVRRKEVSWETNLFVASFEVGLSSEYSAPVSLHLGGSIGRRYVLLKDRIFLVRLASLTESCRLCLHRRRSCGHRA